MPFVKCTNFSLPSLFIKAISLPISPRVTISVHHTHFLLFCISIFLFYFTQLTRQLHSLRVFSQIQCICYTFSFFLELSSIHDNGFASKGVKDIDISLAYHAYLFARNSTSEFCRFLSVCEL